MHHRESIPYNSDNVFIKIQSGTVSETITNYTSRSLRQLPAANNIQLPRLISCPTLCFNFHRSHLFTSVFVPKTNCTTSISRCTIREREIGRERERENAEWDYRSSQMTDRRQMLTVGTYPKKESSRIWMDTSTVHGNQDKRLRCIIAEEHLERLNHILP